MSHCPNTKDEAAKRSVYCTSMYLRPKNSAHFWMSHWPGYDYRSKQYWFVFVLFFIFALFKDTWSQKGHLVSCTLSYYHLSYYFLCLPITRADVRLEVQWAVNLVIAEGHFNLPRKFVWVCTGQSTHFITPEGRREVCYIEQNWAYCDRADTKHESQLNI